MESLKLRRPVLQVTLANTPTGPDSLSIEDGAALALAVSQAASENTRRAYRQQWAAFTAWADEHRGISRSRPWTKPWALT